MPPTFAPSLIDLNDYLGPSQLCIKPVQQESIPQPTPSLAVTEISLDGTDEPGSTTEKAFESSDLAKLKKAEITLNDCLACSGCVTSSESILVSLQSDQQLYDTLSSNPDVYPVLSVSSQSLASLAAYNDIHSMRDAFLSLERFFVDVIGFKLVFDMGFAQALSLRESRRELIGSQQRPLLASSCPGWICYAEKTQGNEVLEMISKVKSAQQIQGALMKSKQMAGWLGVERRNLYHVTVMSCYDKKLEASREDFLSEGEIRDVDCVLTSGEVQRMLDQKGWDLKSMAQEIRDKDETCISGSGKQFIPNWLGKPQPKGSSSGGYLFNAVRSVVLNQSTENLSRMTLLVDRKRGADYSEFVLYLQPPDYKAEAPAAEHQTPATVLFRGAHCYGFKNLQNLVRKVKAAGNKHGVVKGRLSSRKKDRQVPNPDSAFDYVEVMACPSGCLNGGGQIPAPKFLTPEAYDDQPSRQVYTAREWVTQVERKYFSESELVLDHTMLSAYQYAAHERVQQEEIEEWLDYWIPSQEERLKLFRTQYRAIVPETNGFAVQW